MSRASRYASNRQKRIAQSSSPRRTCPSSSLICLYVPSARPRTHAHPPCSPATRNCQPDRVCRTSRCKAASSFRLPSLCPRDSTTLDLGDQRVRDEAVVVLDLDARISAGHVRPPAHRRSPLVRRRTRMPPWPPWGLRSKPRKHEPWPDRSRQSRPRRERDPLGRESLRAARTRIHLPVPAQCRPFVSCLVPPYGLRNPLWLALGEEPGTRSAARLSGLTVVMPSFFTSMSPSR